MTDEGQTAPTEDRAEGRMSFFDHLAELRKRIIWSLVPTLIGLIVCFRFSDRILLFMRQPLEKMDVKLVALTPTEAFWTSMKLSMIAGVFVAMPVILWQVWAFVSPGLHKHERRFAIPFVLIGSLLFVGGAAFALLIVVPFAIQFLLNFGKEQGIQPMISVSSHVDFVIKFTLAFGLVFELPLALTLLSLMGLVTPAFLNKNRKYAVLINFIIAAVLTPTPDIFNQCLMAGPLCLLYEIGILSAWIFGRRKPKKEAEPAPADAGGSDGPPTSTTETPASS